jgi:hypothetical protein
MAVLIREKPQARVPALIDGSRRRDAGGNDLYGDGSCKEQEHAVPPSLGGLLACGLLISPGAVIITAFVLNHTSSVKSQQSSLCKP